MQDAMWRRSSRILVEQQIFLLQNILRNPDDGSAHATNTGISDPRRCFDVFERHLHDCAWLEVDLLTGTCDNEGIAQLLDIISSLSLTVVNKYGSWHRPESFMRCFRSCLRLVLRAEPPNRELIDYTGIKRIKEELTKLFTLLLRRNRHVTLAEHQPVACDSDGDITANSSDTNQLLAVTDVILFLSELYRLGLNLPSLPVDEFFQQYVLVWLDDVAEHTRYSGGNFDVDGDKKLSMVYFIGRLLNSFPATNSVTSETFYRILHHRCMQTDTNDQIRLLAVTPIELAAKTMTNDLFKKLLHACKQSIPIAKQSISVLQNFTHYADNGSDDSEAKISDIFPAECSTQAERLSILDSVLVLLVSSQVHAVRPHLLSLKPVLSSSSKLSELEQLIWWRLSHHEHAHVRVWALRLFLDTKNESFRFPPQTCESLFSIHDFFDGLNAIEIGALVENLLEPEEIAGNSSLNTKSPSISISSIVQHTILLENRLNKFLFRVLTSKITDTDSSAEVRNFMQNFVTFTQIAFGGDRGRKWSFFSLTLLVRSLSSCIATFLADRSTRIEDPELLCAYYQSIQLYFQVCNGWNLADRTYLVRNRPFPGAVKIFSLKIEISEQILVSFLLAMNPLYNSRIEDWNLFYAVTKENFIFSVKNQPSDIFHAAAKQIRRQIDSFTTFAVLSLCLNIPAPTARAGHILRVFENPPAVFMKRLATEFGGASTFYYNFRRIFQQNNGRQSLPLYSLYDYILWVCWFTYLEEEDVVENLTKFSRGEACEENAFPSAFEMLQEKRGTFAAGEIDLIVYELSKIPPVFAVESEPSDDEVADLVVGKGKEIFDCGEPSELRKLYKFAPQLALFIAYHHVLLPSTPDGQAIKLSLVDEAADSKSHQSVNSYDLSSEIRDHVCRFFCEKPSCNANFVLAAENFYERFVWHQECVYFLPDDQLVVLKASRLIFFTLLTSGGVEVTSKRREARDLSICRQFCRTWLARIGEFRDHVDFPRFLIAYAVDVLADAANFCDEKFVFDLFCEASQLACCRVGLVHVILERFIFCRQDFMHSKLVFYNRVLVFCMLYGGQASAANESARITLKNQFPNLVADTMFKYYADNSSNNGDENVKDFAGDFAAAAPEVYADAHTRALALVFVLTQISSAAGSGRVEEVLKLLVETATTDSARSKTARRRQAIANTDEHLLQLRAWQAIGAIAAVTVQSKCLQPLEKVFRAMAHLCKTSLTNDDADACDNSIQPSVRVYMEFAWAVTKVRKLELVLMHAEHNDVAYQKNSVQSRADSENAARKWIKDEILHELLNESKAARPRVAISLLHTMKLTLQLMLNDKILTKRCHKPVLNVLFGPKSDAESSPPPPSSSPARSATLLCYFMLCSVFEWFASSEQLLMRAHGVELCLSFIDLLLPFAGEYTSAKNGREIDFLLSQMRAVLLSLKCEPHENRLTSFLEHENDISFLANANNVTDETRKPTKSISVYEKVQLFRLNGVPNSKFLLFWTNYFVDIPEKCGVDSREHVPAYVLHNALRLLRRNFGERIDNFHLYDLLFGCNDDEARTGAQYFKRMTDGVKTKLNLATEEEAGTVATEQAQKITEAKKSSIFKQKKYRPASSTATPESAPRPSPLVTYTWGGAAERGGGGDNEPNQSISVNDKNSSKFVNHSVSANHPNSKPAFISTLPYFESPVSFYDNLSPPADRRRRHGWKICIVATLLEKLPNLGGLCRTSEVFGVDELVVPNLKAVTEHTFTVLSVGAEKWLKLTEVKRGGAGAALVEFLTLKRQQEGFTIIGLEQTDNSVLLSSRDFSQILSKISSKKLLLVLGAEETGLPGNILGYMDVCVEIPQYGQIGSLNVHTAASVCLWHIISSK